jgi:hypothetical protein
MTKVTRERMEASLRRFMDYCGPNHVLTQEAKTALAASVAEPAVAPVGICIGPWDTICTGCSCPCHRAVAEKAPAPAAFPKPVPYHSAGTCRKCDEYTQAVKESKR